MTDKKKERVQINPFVVNNPLKCKRISEENIIPEAPAPEGYVPSGMTLRRTYLVDAHKKASLYNLGMEVMTDLFYNKLTAKSKDVLLYILIHLPHNQDYIRLPYTTLSKDCKMSRTTVMRALGELRDAGIIQNKNQSVYWVNPAYIFAGGRVKYFSSISEDLIEEL